VRTRTHRYVVDVNRSPSGDSLYPGQNTTGTCPLTDFDGYGIYLPGQEPDETDIATRLALFHAPYHSAMQAEIARIRGRHGIAILFDCHSIRSHIPYLFDGTLPVLNLGTNAGASCAPALQQAAWDIARTSPFEAVANGRFKGGWTTRHYGQPGRHVHALQMEIAQRAYLAAESPPWDYDPVKADALRGTLRQMLETLRDHAMEMPR
jgi:formiminoglutamase